MVVLILFIFTAINPKWSTDVTVQGTLSSLILLPPPVPLAVLLPSRHHTTLRLQMVLPRLLMEVEPYLTTL